MFSKSNFTLLIAYITTVIICGCRSLSTDKQLVCNESIRISFFDSSKSEAVTDYKIYEVTNYPEGIIVKLQTVAEQYRYKDSLGVTCLPVLKEESAEAVRKFVLVKDGYVYTEYYLKNRATDTLLKAIMVESYK